MSDARPIPAHVRREAATLERWHRRNSDVRIVPRWHRGTLELYATYVDSKGTVWNWRIGVAQPKQLDLF